MKKRIGIIPAIIERRKSINLIIDYKLISFIKKCYPKSEIEILSGENIKNKLNLIVSSGGNTIIFFNKNLANKFRAKLDMFYFKYALKKNIPFFGICHGAQFIAHHYKSKIMIKKKHTKTNHLIKLNLKKEYLVNSYHDFSIIKLNNSLKKIAWTKDGSIEAFKHKTKKIFGVMWHPERYKKIKKFDLELVNKNL